MRSGTFFFAGVMGIGCHHIPAAAEPAQAPLFLALQPKPNIMFTLDDSASMDESPSQLAYDADQVYQPWRDANGASYPDKGSNKANWEAYWSTGLRAAKAAVSLVFSQLSDGARIGFGQVSAEGSTVDGVLGTGTVVSGVRDFSGNDRQLFFDKLFAAKANGTASLRRAVDDVGRYFGRTDAKGPWAEFPGVSKGTEFSCRKNFHILMAGGQWGQGAAATAGASNADKVAGSNVDAKNNPGNYPYAPYVAGPPFAGTPGSADTLADVVMHYWKNDLRSDLDNIVAPSAGNPAFWQHVVQYTLGLGAKGMLAFPDDAAKLISGVLAWPDPGSGNSAAAVDDLWHAAINGHGRHFSAAKPADIQSGLMAALDDSIRQSGAAASVTFDARQISSAGALAYATGFDAATWTGHVRARKVGQGGKSEADAWDAAEKIPSAAKRNIATWNSDTGAGVDFISANLGAQQKLDLSDSKDGSLLRYLRGDSVQEKQNGGPYRNRAGRLGDIVNSRPLYVKASDSGYRKIAADKGGSKYKAFVEVKKSHTPYLYVGANDGMLHQFDAATGIEKFSYVPAAVFPHLKKLSDPNYIHRYYVDGQFTEGDAYLNGAWKNILLGTTGAGARSVFAIDISQPDSLGAASVKWEISASGDFIDLGYVLGKAYIARSRTGDWVAVFGNGYDSATKKAVLYIVNLATGELLQKIEVAGDANRPNGLSAPAFLFNGNRELVTAYAGDLQGNLWKFDLSASDKSSWKVSFGGKPLFAARNAREEQPITQEPLIDFAPQGGYMIAFGTGKIFEESDRKSARVESIYGIWDPATVSATAVASERSTALVEQKLGLLGNGNRSLTANPIDWDKKRGWYVDLALESGERPVGEFLLSGDVLTVATFTPGGGAVCDPAGTSQLLAFDYKTGGAYGKALFDDPKASSIAIPATLAGPSVVLDPKPSQPDSALQVIRPGIAPFSPAGEDDRKKTDKGKRGGPAYKIAINRQDGSGIQLFNVQPSGAPIVRTWRRIFIND